MSATTIFPSGLCLIEFDDGYRVQIPPALDDGSFVATAFKHSAAACEGKTRDAAIAAAFRQIEAWRALQ